MIDIAQYAGILDWAKHDFLVMHCQNRFSALIAGQCYQLLKPWRGKANWMTALTLK
jgi:hypothetical protein